MADIDPPEWVVVLRVAQTVPADSPAEAEAIARAAVNRADALWWPSVLDEPAEVEQL